MECIPWRGDCTWYIYQSDFLTFHNTYSRSSDAASDGRSGDKEIWDSEVCLRALFLPLRYLYLTEIFRTASNMIYQGLPAIFTFLSTTSILALVDYMYFTSELPFLKTSAPFFLTPVNSLLYNVKTSNLEGHGLHPRWLHSVVNAPMLFGVALISVGTVAWGVRRDNTSSEERTDYETNGMSLKRRLCIRRQPHLQLFI